MWLLGSHAIPSNSSQGSIWTFEIVAKEVRYGDLTKQYEVPLSRMLHDILDDDHIQWHPPFIGHYTNFLPLLIRTLLPNLTFYLIMRGLHRTFATGAACKQRTLTPPVTWSCLTLGLPCVLMSRPITPELVWFPDFWVSNIPPYFSFACKCKYFLHKVLFTLSRWVMRQCHVCDTTGLAIFPVISSCSWVPGQDAPCHQSLSQARSIS